jgi:septal ring factor EnvC (AmiA/AmiB activator)
VNGTLLAVVLSALLAGGPALTYIAIRKATPERESFQVGTASKNTQDALALLAAEREAHRAELERLAHEIERMTGELAATRRDRQHDREAIRQLATANEALQDEVVAERQKCADVARERDRLIELVRDQGGNTRG